MIRVAGLDVGFSLTRKSSGVAILEGDRLELRRSLGGAHASAPILDAAPLAVIAIDGPIVPANGKPGAIRPVERLFASGAFQKRCKPGFSHVPGTGSRLREAAGAAADSLAAAAPCGGGEPAFPLVRDGRIVEAFPNAFLGVCLDDRDFAAMPNPMRRGGKFDWLFDRWVERGCLRRLPIGDAADELARRFAATRNHDERAALVCALTARLVARGDFTAVGDADGGWFFLPPWQAWRPWAQHAVWQGRDRLQGDHGGVRPENAATPDGRRPTIVDLSGCRPSP